MLTLAFACVEPEVPAARGSNTDSVASDDGEIQASWPDDVPGPLALPDLSGADVVYIHVDTLRRDHLGPYGYDRHTFSFMDDGRWIVLDGLTTAGSSTLPSTAALFAGAPPWINGVRSPEASPGATRLLVPSVADLAVEAGWDALVITGNNFLSIAGNLAGGFGWRVSVPKNTDTPNLLAMVPEFERVIAENDGRRLFVHLQPMDMHAPYWVAPEDRGTFLRDPPPFDLDEADAGVQAEQIATALSVQPFAATGALNAVYDEQILGLERGILRVLEVLEDAGRLDSTVVVVSADHGETLNDARDGAFGHGHTLRGELVGVPLAVLAPGVGGRRVRCVASNGSVWPSIAGPLGLADPGTWSYPSLAEACPGVAVSSLWHGRDTLGALAATDGVAKVEHLCGLDGQTFVRRAFDLVADPGSLSPVAVELLSTGAALEAELDRVLAEIEDHLPGSACLGP